MKDLLADIQEDLALGVLSTTEIARKHHVPVEWVREAWDMLCEQEFEQN